MLGGTIVGEEYLELGSVEVKDMVAKIRQQQPDLILNTINGDSNGPFFRELHSTGVMPQTIPTMSFSIAEPEVNQIGNEIMVGNYAAWNYFQSIGTDENKRFVEAFRQRHGKDRVVSDPMEAAYFGVYLWKQAVEDADSDDVQAIRRNIRGQSMKAPQGIVCIDAYNQHTWKGVQIGRVERTGQFTIVWTSDKPVAPAPYPSYKTKMEWQAFRESTDR